MTSDDPRAAIHNEAFPHGPVTATKTCGASLAIETAPARDDAAARSIERGAMRLLRAHGYAALTQFALPDGRRADLAGLSGDGRIVIVEIKSCLADFRADGKWHHYREFADALYFAVDPSFPAIVLPEDAGLIVADRFGGQFLREAPSFPLAAARRKSITIRFARTAAARLHAAADPDVDARIE